MIIVDDPVLPLKIFSVDPATGKSGWSVLLVESLRPLVIRVLAHGQLDGQKLLRTKKELQLSFQKQYCVLDALYEAYVNLITEHSPDVVVSEGAFGYKHLNALISLTLAINTLRRASHTTIGKDVYEIAPMSTKKAFSGVGNADKDMMRRAYLASTYLTRTDVVDISEHEIDSVAHAVGYIKIHLLKDVDHKANKITLKSNK